MGHRSPFPDVHVPAVPVTDYIFEHANSYPDKCAIVDAASGKTLTYGDLCRLVRRMAAGLAAKGFGKGDLLAVYTPPIPEYAVLFYGASLAGGAVTPMNPTQMVAELRYQLNDSASRFLVTTPELLQAATRAGCRTAVEHVFVVGEAAGATPLETLLECADSAPGVQISPEQDVAAVPYSLSGIPGGLPVGVMLSHRNLVASVAQLSVAAPITRHDVVLTTPAPSQNFGMLFSMNSALRAGATIVLAPYLDVAVVLGAIDRLAVTTAYLGTPLLRILARHRVIDDYDLSSLKYIVTGFTPFAERYSHDCAARLGCTVRRAYGLVETTFVTHLASGKSAIDGVSAAGFGVPNTEFKIVEVEHRREAAIGSLGEVCVRGPQVMLGYFNNVEATEAALDADGWLHTGDIGYVAKDGCLYMEGVKALITRRSRRGDVDSEMLQPVIDHMATQRQLTRQLTFQSLLLDSVRESVVALDNEYHVTFWNKGAESLFGYTAQEALGNAVGNLILPDAEAARAEWVAHMDALRRTGTWKGSTLRRRKDGTLFWTDVSASMVTDADGQPSGFVALHRDITELQRHQDELRDSHQRLRNLAASLIEVRELERTSLARELHDELGQVLTRLKIDLQWLCGRLPKYLRTLRTRQMMRLVDRIIDTTRHISSQLRPAILDDLGLEAALEWQTQEFVKWGRCRCKLDLCLEELRSNRERDTTVFRIVQEALTNVARHSQATAVHVGGRIAEGTLEVELHDNGIGLPERKLASKDSLGLIGMRERAEGIGGTVQFSRSPAGGTLVKIRVPLESQLRERTS